MTKDKKETSGNRELSSNLPDLGMFFLKQGIGSSPIVIPGVPFINFYQLAGDKIRSSLQWHAIFSPLLTLARSISPASNRPRSLKITEGTPCIFS